jgi:hypothetical protein
MPTDHEMRMEALRLFEENEKLREVLRAVVADVHEYERVNNLHPNPGRKYCWDSVARAHRLID